MASQLERPEVVSLEGVIILCCCVNANDKFTFFRDVVFMLPEGFSGPPFMTIAHDGWSQLFTD